MASEDVLVDEDGNLIEEAQGVEDKNKLPEDEDGEEDDKASGSGEDSNLSADDDDDDHHEDGEGEGGTDAEREAIRERRRQERKLKKERQKEREDTLRRELAARDAQIAELSEKVGAIQRRDNSSQLAQLDGAIQQSAQAYNFFKQKVSEATEAADGRLMADATEKMYQAQRRFEELSKVKQAMSKPQPKQPALDPRIANLAQDWMGKNKWYDPNGSDIDSRIALTLDQGLADEGYSPATQEYWQELSKRVAKYLPHRAQKTYNRRADAGSGRSPVAGSGRESSGGSKSGFVLSADRVQAIKDAGLWNDPAKRAEAIKRYREYDKQNQQG